MAGALVGPQLGFGLIHGLGFASTLSKLLPPSHVVVPLLCFNVGVEIGQLSIVVVVLPILYVVAMVVGAQAYRRYVLPALAGCFALAALYWFISRRGERRIELRNKAFELLACFLRHPQRVLSRRELLTHAPRANFATRNAG